MTDDRDRARAWWATGIIDMAPGSIRVRGYPIEQLIGAIDFPQMIWLMLRGEVPTREQAALLGAALVAAVDHGPQAPSIAIARMAMSCGVDVNNAMASAINVLGDVHGGAGEQAMALFDEVNARMDYGADIAHACDVALGEWTAKHGKIVPGFGHRFHPVDPRAPRLLALVDDAAKAGVVGGRFAAIARSLASLLERGTGRSLPLNIDGATATIFCELGFASSSGRGLFILSRAVGILAHAQEQAGRGERIKGPIPPDFLYEYTGAKPRDWPP